ncbi:MAG: radical SAM protein, partial [Actinomycetota bacterium]|nr:radical SAM protein [Actinomycetota bacterium]
EAGVPCGVLMAPILPWLTDAPAELERTVRAIAETGATHLSPMVLHLRPGAREWWFAWLRREHPALVPRYAALYRRGSYADAAYQERVLGQVRELADRYGIGRRPSARPTNRWRGEPAGSSQAPAQVSEPEQMALL